MKKDKESLEVMIKEWYTKTAASEWRRLKRNPYRQIEFLVTTHFLEKHLPKSGLVLDAGGGPGRYAIELAERGYDVVLLDLTPRMLKIARRNIREAEVQIKVKQVVEGSIADLSMFDAETFDAVLCLGAPLTHILEEEERKRAVKELVRVARENSPIFISVIGRIGLLKSMLTKYPHEMQYIKTHWKTGDYVPGVSGKGFTAAHWFLPEELKRLAEEHGIQTLEMAGLEGLSSHHQRATDKLSRNPERWKLWLNMILETCTHPAVVGGAEHFLLVGRKRK
ncbi:MAG: class I SAM-dependent methyltransferase [Candidatus Bathyarchaeia archaeon]